MARAIGERGPCRALALFLSSALFLAGSQASAEERRCQRDSGLRARQLSASPAPAALEPVAGPNFVMLPDAAALAEAACAPPIVANTLLVDAVERVRAATGIDPQIAVVLSTAPLSCASLYYVSVANDTRGIGYRHEDPREIFDDSAHSRLEGVAFLNDFPYWQSRPDEFARAFAHEIGHRFGARVHVQRAGLAPDALLGRQDFHWSYYLDSGGSPLEGNRWASAGQAWRAETPLSPARFSDLDLYLMGVLPPERVRAATLLRAEPATERDCLDRPLSAVSPPQTCGAIDFDATPISFTIGEIIAAEGPRVPAAHAGGKTIEVAFIVLEASSAPSDSAMCHALSSALAERITDFERATGGSVRLRNLTDLGASCDDWPSLTKNDAPESAAGCDFGRASPLGAWPPAALLILAAGVRLRLRAVRREPNCEVF